MSNIIDITGQRFGRLVVIESSGRSGNYDVTWLCRCDCGKEKVIVGSSLKRGGTKSCGCLFADLYTPKGELYKATYNSWEGMMRRCNNAKSDGYKKYGARGINICVRWLSFANFHSDMGDRPEGRTIDRINNDDGYHCGHCDDCQEHGWVANCRWATLDEQANNRRYDKCVSVNGDLVTLKKASSLVGIPYSALKWRKQNGWSTERALSEPVKSKG
jgi:hypothetical protein